MVSLLKKGKRPYQKFQNGGSQERLLGSPGNGAGPSFKRKKKKKRKGPHVVPLTTVVANSVAAAHVVDKDNSFVKPKFGLKKKSMFCITTYSISKFIIMDCIFKKYIQMAYSFYLL